MLVHLTHSLREQMANQSPLGFFLKNHPVLGQAVHRKILQAAVAGSILGNYFLRQFRITVAPETSQALFACTAMATAKLFLPNVLPITEPSVSVPSAMQPIPDFVPEDMERLL
jgi:hypothetical protein